MRTMQIRRATSIRTPTRASRFPATLDSPLKATAQSASRASDAKGSPNNVSRKDFATPRRSSHSSSTPRSLIFEDFEDDEVVFVNGSSAKKRALPGIIYNLKI